MKSGYRVKPSSLLTGLSPSNRRGMTAPSKKTITITPDDGESIEAKVEKLFSGQDLLFERLHSEPKWSSRAYNKAKTGAGQASVFVRKQPFVSKIAMVIVPALLIGGVFWQFSSNTEENINEVAGVTDSIVTPLSLEIVKPSFSMVIPNGKTEDDFKFAIVSPEGNAPVYAYIDQIDQIDIKVSQQEIPQQFIGRQDQELEQVAKNFQAINVIQVDETKVYHGVSDKLKVQSLVFIKNDRLIFIASPEELKEDVWVGYILNLK